MEGLNFYWGEAPTMKHEEHLLQCTIIKLLRLNKIFCFAIPNGGRRDAREGARLKKEGVLAGVSDIAILANRRVYFTEIKIKKGRQTESQKEFERNVRALGCEYQVWRSLDDAISFVNYILYVNGEL